MLRAACRLSRGCSNPDGAVRLAGKGNHLWLALHLPEFSASGLGPLCTFIHGIRYPLTTAPTYQLTGSCSGLMLNNSDCVFFSFVFDHKAFELPRLHTAPACTASQSVDQAEMHRHSNSSPSKRLWACQINSGDPSHSP